METQTSTSLQALMASVQGYGLSKEELAKLQSNLTTFASGRIAAHMQEAANTALSRMKDRSALHAVMPAFDPSCFIITALGDRLCALTCVEKTGWMVFC